MTLILFEVVLGLSNRTCLLAQFLSLSIFSEGIFDDDKDIAAYD